MRGTVTRLSRLEAKRGPKPESRFYIFGLDEDDAAERLAVEIRAGAIGRADAYRTPVWRGTTPMPAPRWATPLEMTRDELVSAIHDLARATDREPLADYDDTDALAAEIIAIKREIPADELVWG